MKYLVNLIYFRHNQGHGNFGDELSVFITKKLINTHKYELLLSTKGIQLNLVCIGSCIHGALHRSYVFGSGVRTPDQHGINRYYKTLRICAVRGPKTREFLVSIGVKVPEIYGDPALLLPKFYIPLKDPALQDKLALIPHISNYSKYTWQNLDTTRYELINPTDHWQTVINKLASCKCVISNSLHGLICADAYGIPNIWLTEHELPEGRFKFEDYMLSQNRPIANINSLAEFDESLCYSGGNQIDLDKLVAAFPFK
jgi:pyruvyltransferase